MNIATLLESAPFNGGFRAKNFKSIDPARSERICERFSFLARQRIARNP